MYLFLLFLLSFSAYTLSASHHHAPFAHPMYAGGAAAALRLRGGSGQDGKVADSNMGVWQSFSRSSGVEWSGDDVDGPPIGFGLAPRQACKWGRPSVGRRSQPSLHLRVVVDSEMENGDTVVAVGERIGLEGFGNAEGSWETIRIKMRKKDKKDNTWEARARIPPGTYKFKYVIQANKGGYMQEKETETLEGDSEHRTIVVLPSPPQDALLLVTDIDGTLIGDDSATINFFETWNGKYRPRGSNLVYNTGRPHYSVMRLILDGKIDVPDALVCSEGTEIYWFNKPWLKSSRAEPEAERDMEWQQVCMDSWDYPKVKEAIKQCTDQYADCISKLMFLPDPEYQNGQPMIVIAIEDENVKNEVMSQIDTMRKEKLLAFEVIASCSGTSWYLLIIPRGASKGSAAMHCAKRLGYEPERIMVSGDGENDVPLFQATRQGFKGTMVGNVCEGLKQWVGKKQRENVYQATRGYAEGILEGLQHHFCSMFAMDRDNSAQDSKQQDVAPGGHAAQGGTDASDQGVATERPPVIVTDSSAACVVVSGSIPTVVRDGVTESVTPSCAPDTRLVSRF